MTDKEVVQALRQCTKRDCSSCGMCPIFQDRECVEHLAAAAASLIERLTAENAAMRENVLQWISVEADRLRELAEADKAGRCVVLPCKVGEKIYYLNGKYSIEVEVVGYKVDETGAWLFIGETYNPETNRAYHCDLETERIGKTVFFTREEAERAMEGRKEADHA